MARSRGAFYERDVHQAAVSYESNVFAVRVRGTDHEIPGKS